VAGNSDDLEPVGEFVVLFANASPCRRESTAPPHVRTRLLL